MSAPLSRCAPLSRRGALRLALGGGAALIGAGASPGHDAPRSYRRAALAFGTTVSIALRAPGPRDAEAAFAAAFAEVRRVDRLASLTAPDGELFRLNRDGALRDPHPDLVAMLRMAARLHAATEGAFDATVQPMWLAFDAAARRGAWPAEAEIAALRARVDGAALLVAEDRVAFARPGMAATLNSLARGLAADRVAGALARRGIADALFDVDVLGALGRRPDGTPWRVAVRHPRDPGASVGTAELRGCLATSGDYEYFWSADYSRNHIIDPRRGRSPAGFSSVAVAAGDGLTADGLSTAAFLLDRPAAEALLARFGAEALFVDKAGGATATPGFAGSAAVS